MQNVRFNNNNTHRFLYMMTSVFLVLTSILFLILFLFLFLFLSVSHDETMDRNGNGKNEEHGKLKEHLTLHASIPNDLPKIEMNKNVFEASALDVHLTSQKSGETTPYVIYVKSSNIDSLKMLMFTNSNTWNARNVSNGYISNDLSPIGYKIVALDDSSAHLALQIMELTNLGPSSIESIGKSDFLGIGYDAWKCEENLLFCMLINEDDSESKEIADAMNTWSIKAFDYLYLIDKKYLAQLYPFGKVQSFITSSIFPQKKELTFIYEIIAFDKVVYIEKDGDIMQARKHISDGVIKHLQEFYALSSTEPENDKNALVYYEMLGFHVHMNEEV